LKTEILYLRWGIYMEKIEQVDIETLSLPDELNKWIGNAPIYESSGESGARTVFINRDGGAFLKISAYGSLLRSSQLQTYFSKHKLSSPVIQYLSVDRDYLITAPIKGDDGISEKYLAEPQRLSEVFGQSLRLLHEVDASDCPIKDRMSELRLLAGSSSFRQTHLDDIAKFIGIAHAGTSFEEITALSGLLKNDVLIHGDYCLPNIILNNWAFEGFIDVADGGLGDRHYDLAWGLWTLKHNLKSSKYGRRFLDAYGRDCIDKDRLRICGLLAAME
jgi:kanamycin kinase